jgi:hypothetical protein
LQLVRVRSPVLSAPASAAMDPPPLLPVLPELLVLFPALPPVLPVLPPVLPVLPPTLPVLPPVLPVLLPDWPPPPLVPASLSPASASVPASTGDAVQVPLWHVPVVQFAPSGFAGLEHAPVVESQAPASWHSSIAAHTTGFAPVQAPATQAYSPKQASAVAGAQVVPSLRVAVEHLPVWGSHVPAAWQLS